MTRVDFLNYLFSCDRRHLLQLAVGPTSLRRPDTVSVYKDSHCRSLAVLGPDNDMDFLEAPALLAADQPAPPPPAKRPAKLAADDDQDEKRMLTEIYGGMPLPFDNICILGGEMYNNGEAAASALVAANRVNLKTFCYWPASHKYNFVRPFYFMTSVGGDRSRLADAMTFPSLTTLGVLPLENGGTPRGCHWHTPSLQLLIVGFRAEDRAATYWLHDDDEEKEVAAAAADDERRSSWVGQPLLKLWCRRDRLPAVVTRECPSLKRVVVCQVGASVAETLSAILWSGRF